MSDCKKTASDALLHSSSSC